MLKRELTSIDRILSASKVRNVAPILPRGVNKNLRLDPGKPKNLQFDGNPRASSLIEKRSLIRSTKLEALEAKYKAIEKSSQSPEKHLELETRF
jgi:hypothetical protein